MSATDFTSYHLRQLHFSDSSPSSLTIIGGSDLFHGAPLLALKTASRLVATVFFTSPEPSVNQIAQQLKSQLFSFIWFPYESQEIAAYIQKSAAVLIGPGFKRYRQEASLSYSTQKQPLHDDPDAQLTKTITHTWIKQFPHRQWIIDAGSLQVLDPRLIPDHAILTPNHFEFSSLFNVNSINQMPLNQQISTIQNLSAHHHCIITYKGPTTIISDSEQTYTIPDIPAGFNKGGIGDILAGLTAALITTNPPLLAAAAAAFLTKQTALELNQTNGSMYNADDLADHLPQTLHRLTSRS